MKCRFVIDVDVELASMPSEMRRHVLYRDVKTNRGVKQLPYWPAGTEYETPQAAFFVRQGMAVPADFECQMACGIKLEEMPALQHAYQRQAKGILQQDWELFDAGYIVGYEPDGGYTPGPKWDEYQAKLAAEDADDDEL